MIKKLYQAIRQQLAEGKSSHSSFLTNVKNIKSKDVKENKSNKNNNKNNNKAQQRLRLPDQYPSLLQELEPRFMFDGAAIETVDLADGVSQDEQNYVLSAINDNEYAHATESLLEAIEADSEGFQTDYSQFKEVVIVDIAVKDPHVLIEQISRDAAVEVILAHHDGVDKIAEILAKYQNLDAVHIISHGDQAQLQLGQTHLTASNLTDYQTQLAQWGQSLTQTGDILFYGCNVAEGKEGQAFVDTLREMTDADIAASDDTTGSELVGGDSILEQAQDIEHSSVVSFEAYQHTLSVEWLGSNAPNDAVLIGSGSSAKYGQATALSGDGTLAVVGQPDFSSSRGGFRVIGYNELNDEWETKASITGGSSGYKMGHAVAISDSGDRIIVSEPKSSTDTGGRVKVYSFDGSNLTQLGNTITISDDKFVGHSVAISDDGQRIAVTSIDVITPSLSKNLVRIFKYDLALETWVQIGSDITSSSNFSHAQTFVSLDEMGEHVAIKMANLSESIVKVYQYQEVSDQWQIVGADLDSVTEALATGEAISISDDGKTVAVGYEYYDSNVGLVRVYHYDDNLSAWTRLGGDLSNGLAGSYFGNSVSISDDGMKLVVGEKYADNGLSPARDGRFTVYAYNTSSTSWETLGQFFGNPGEELGKSVSISGDGRAVAVGASGYDAPSNSNIGRVAFYRVNSAPEVSVATTQIYTVATLAMFMDDSLTLIDQDPGEIITGATITITNGYIQSEDVLSFDNTATPNISGSFVSGTGVLSLSGNDTVQNYQQALRNVKYQNTNATTPDLSDRTIVFKATDDDNSESEGATVILSINALPVINAPASLNANVALELSLENQISITDDIDPNATNFTVTLSVTHGVLNISNTTGVSFFLGGNGQSAMTIQGKITDINNAIGTLSYTSNANQSNDTLLLQVNDMQGGITNESIAIAINALPSLTLQSNAETFDEDTTLTFNTANSNLITVADSDTDVNVTLSAPSGTFTLSQTTGLTFVSGANATKDMTISGTVANINAALNGLTYLPREDFFGNLAIDVTVEDTFTATDGNQFSQSDTINLTINAVNDAPIFSLFDLSKIMASDAEVHDRFGQSIAMSADENTVAVGARQTDTSGTYSHGSVYVYHNIGGSWVEKIVTATPKEGYAFFGASVELSNNGMTLLVGADNSGGNSRGKVYLFDYDGANWNQVETFQPSISEVGDNFGGTITLADSQDLFAVGVDSRSIAANEQEGGVYIYRKVLGVWQESYITADVPQADEHFGFAVKFSYDGQKLYVGANGGDYQPSVIGKVYEFTWNGSQWQQTAEIQAPDGHSGNAFGESISLSEDGAFMLIGATDANVIHNAQTINEAGKVYIYSLSSEGNWVYEQSVQALTPVESDRFGSALSVSPQIDKIYIGAKSSPSQAGASSGSVYVFKKDNLGDWQFLEEMTPQGVGAQDNFGSAIAFSDDGSLGVISAVGTPLNSEPDVGAVYFFETNALTAFNTLQVDEQTAALLIDDLSFNVEDDTNFNGATLLLESTGSSQDNFSVLNQGIGAEQISISGSDISYENNLVGTIDDTNDGQGGNDLRINFTTNDATLISVEALIRALQYYNSSDAPTFSRTIQLSITDTEGLQSNVVTQVIEVNPVNDLPTAANAEISIDEDEVYSFAAADFNFDDIDGDSLASVQVTSLSSSGVLALNGSTVAINDVISRTDIDNENFTYTPIANESGDDYATFTFKVGDGALLSTADCTMTIDVAAVNDAPVVTAGASATYTEGDTQPVVIDNTVTIADIDSNDIHGATIQITSGLSSAEDVLHFVNQNNITHVFDAGTGLLTLTGVDTLANYQTALRSITYENTSNSPSTTAREIIWIVNDGEDNSLAVTSTVNVVAVNTAPVISVLGSVNYVENATAIVLDANLVVSDADNVN
ncbi:DUF4347 domain-containing protein [Cysteiniphilum marinum]|uniref:DUF4347 domain-containing protein n=1 Tax=Cysteiniphilum marinum TaxID=2774191 RepID=UPI001939DE4D|nr:DUF4347 domain-containing protein [Cysteiniphilum marinum]